MLSMGSYSDYAVRGPLEVLRDFDTDEVAYHGRACNFASYLLQNGLVREVTCVHWDIGDGTFDPCEPYRFVSD